MNPFEIFGLEPAFDLDEAKIQQLYYDASKKLHPDRFAAQDAATRAKSQELSATLNQAYSALKDKEARLELLLKLKGLVKEEQKSASQSEIPMDLAEEFFELQEFVMESAEDNPQLARDHIKQFRTELALKNAALTDVMFVAASKIDWKAGKSGAAAIDAILKLRKDRSYIVSMLENLDKLENRIAQ